MDGAEWRAPPFALTASENRRAIMPKEEMLEFDGTVIEVLPDGNYRVKLDNEHMVLAYGRRQNEEEPHSHPRRRPVIVEMSPYDLDRGRISFRHKTGPAVAPCPAAAELPAALIGGPARARFAAPVNCVMHSPFSIGLSFRNLHASLSLSYMRRASRVAYRRDGAALRLVAIASATMAACLFIDLRDHYGLSQIVADPDSPAFQDAEKLRSEWVVKIDGEVRKRPAGTENPDLPTARSKSSRPKSRCLSCRRIADAGVRRAGISRRHSGSNTAF